MITCREVTELVTEYLEGTMPWRQRLALRLHLAMCRHCREYVRQVRTVVRVAGTLGSAEVPPPSPEVEARLGEVFARWRAESRQRDATP